MKAPPLILVTPSTTRSGAEFYDYSVTLSDAYTAAVVQAGGVPLIAPVVPEQKLIEEVVARCDGVALSGGDDIGPRLYNESAPDELVKKCLDVDPNRDLFELMVVKEVFRQRKPLLAICRGHQIVNIALGGDLIIDIPTQAPSEITHARMDLKDKVVHPVRIEGGSMMKSVLGQGEVGVNSTHHQAIGRLAPGLKVVARAADGIVEATELAEPLLPYYLSVQFHPERLVRREPVFQKLFRSFTAACAVNRNEQA
jgi:putative glutamine amidotransferase